MDLKEWVRKYLHDTGCTKRSFAKKIGTSVSFLNYWLRGERNMALSTEWKTQRVISQFYEI